MSFGGFQGNPGYRDRFPPHSFQKGGWWPSPLSFHHRDNLKSPPFPLVILNRGPALFKSKDISSTALKENYIKRIMKNFKNNF